MKEWVGLDRRRSREKEVLGARMEAERTEVKGRKVQVCLRKRKQSCLTQSLNISIREKSKETD